METLLSVMSFSLAGGYAAAVLVLAGAGAWIWRRRTRLGRRLARQEAVRTAIRTAGGRRRLGLLRRRQRANMLEMAAIVSRQLETVSQALHPCLYQRASVAIERTVETLDFDRLYSLHGLLCRSGGEQMAMALETLLQGKR